MVLNIKLIKLNHLYLLVFFCMGFVLVIYSGQILSYLIDNQKKYFPIEQVKVTHPLQYIDPEQVKDKMLPLLDRGFFALSVEKVRKQLLEIPWVRQAYVKKQWPNQLILNITEHEPVALWYTGGVVTKEGVFLQEVGDFFIDTLPQVGGVQGRWSTYIDSLLTLNSLLASTSLSISSLQWMPDGSWQTMLNNKAVLFLGKDNLVEKLKRFIHAYEKQLSSEMSKISYVDLRYTNGLAVGWREKMNDLSRYDALPNNVHDK